MSVGGATAFFLRTWCGKRELCLCGESKLLRNEVVLVLVLLVVRLSALASRLKPPASREKCCGGSLSGVCLSFALVFPCDRNHCSCALFWLPSTICFDVVSSFCHIIHNHFVSSVGVRVFFLLSGTLW